tara:strand:+ start:3351 stop:3554 length:204 start_codon:yes stop_codon:yes gene_type:complete
VGVYQTNTRYGNPHRNPNKLLTECPSLARDLPLLPRQCLALLRGLAPKQRVRTIADSSPSPSKNFSF